MALFSRHAISPEEDALIETVAHATAQVIQAARVEQEREELHRRLIDVSREAGMAEVATGVLHNVGNVLNSVNVSASIVGDKLRQSRVSGVAKAAGLMREHTDDLGGFMASDEKGRQLPGYLAKLGEHLVNEQAAMLDELASLCRNIEHIKDVVNTQQNYARMAGIAETFSITEPIENALRLSDPSFERHGITVVREYEDTPELVADRHKVLQILINLVRNAKQALRDSRTQDKCLKVRVLRADGDRVRVEVIDNGVGIPAENMGRIFSHGFTTKPDGHGFGLHNSALAAKEMDGSLTAHSDGPDQGATFVLELPLTAGEQDTGSIARKTWRRVRPPETVRQ